MAPRSPANHMTTCMRALMRPATELHVLPGKQLASSDMGTMLSMREMSRMGITSSTSLPSHAGPTAK